MRRPSRAHRASSRRNACHGIDRRANQSFDPAGEALHSRRFSTEEHDLRFVIERNNIGLTGRIGPRPLTIAQSLRALGVAGMLGTADEKALRKAVGIRNRAVHEVKELSRDEALLMLDTVQDFRNRYVNPTQDRF